MAIKGSFKAHQGKNSTKSISTYKDIYKAECFELLKTEKPFKFSSGSKPKPEKKAKTLFDGPDVTNEK